MNIYRMTDFEWWIGPSLDACKADYLETTGEPADEDAHELSDADLDTWTVNDIDDDERPTGIRWTYREQRALEIADGGTFPRLFASSAL